MSSQPPTIPGQAGGRALLAQRGVEWFRELARRSAEARRARMKGNIIEALTTLAGMVADDARSNVMKEGLPSDIADAIFIGEVVEKDGQYYIDVKVDLGDPNALGDARQARSSARAFEYGSGESATKGPGGTYVIAPREAPVLAFPWPGHFRDFPPGKKFIYASEDGTFFFHYVDHPGVEARPFLQPAIKANKAEMKRLLKSAFKRAMVGPAFEVIEVKI